MMIRFHRILSMLIFFALVSYAVTIVKAATHMATSPEFEDVQVAVNAAVSGDTVLIPAGSASWTNSLLLDKGIHLQGAGAGGFKGHSSTFLDIEIGLKTFATQPDLDLQPGQTVRALYTRDGSLFMEGKVTVYNGTSLQLDVTQTGGSGRYEAWTLAVPGLTMITNNAADYWDKALITLAEDTDHNVVLSGIHFIHGTVIKGNHINIYQEPGGKPVLIHDCWFSAGGGLTRAIHVRSKQGVIYRNSFDTGLWDGPGLDNQGIAVTWAHAPNSWTTPDTMGIKDTTGLNNFYIEDNYFAGIYLQAMDFDGNSRTVVRHNIFNNSALASHGPETNPDGLRHFELYDNIFIFDNLGTETYPLNWWLYLRGGTGIITDNIMPNIRSQEWGDKSEITLIIQNLRRNVGPYPGWETYPSPRQVGQGHDGTGNILDPLYIWNNSGNPVVGIYDYNPDTVGKNLHTADYVKVSRDYYEGVAKPGYIKYPYPHPLNGGPLTHNPPKGETIFTSQFPAAMNLTDGTDNELGIRFQSSKAGKVTGIRFWKDANETATHFGQIWSNSGQSLASVIFSGETASGWQSQSLTLPLAINANTEYTVSVNTGSYYVATGDGLAAAISNGALSSIAGGNGVYSLLDGLHPMSTFNNTNYFRDVYFMADSEPGSPPASDPFLNILTTETPEIVGLADSIDYELGARFQSNMGGEITGIRFWKDANETGTHVGQIWSSSGQSLASVIFSDETTSGWQSQSLVSPLAINANTEYTVSVNTRTYYVATSGGLASTISNGTLSSISDNNGVFSIVVGSHPTSSFNDTNYFRDIYFTPDSIPEPPPETSIFSTEIPESVNLADGIDYELGARFQSSVAGKVTGIRFWKDANEIGSHVGQIWSISGQLLASVTFTDETTSGWQSQNLASPLAINANTEYTVSVNTGGYYVATSGGLTSAISNGTLSTTTGSNGVFSLVVGSHPTGSFNDTNYFRDIYFQPDSIPESLPDTTITSVETSIFSTETPEFIGLADGIDYELGARFQSSVQVR